MHRSASSNSVLRVAGVLTCLLMAALAHHVAVAEASQRDSTLDRVLERGILVAGISRGIPMFAKENEQGDPAGFDVDIITGLAKHLGVQVQFVPLAGATRITAVQAGHVDLTAARLTASPEHLRLVDFSATYFHDARRILVPRKSLIRGPGDLAGQRVGVVRGPAGRELLRLSPAAIPVPFASSREAFPALVTGRIDAIAAETTVLEGLKALLQEPDSLQIVDAPLSLQAYCLALPKGDVHWQQQVNTYLDLLAQEGRWETMARRWFGERAPLPYPDGFHPAEAERR